MKEQELLYLPVSLGEAIDKLTILDIKFQRINDDRKKDIINEYNILYEKLKEFVIKYDQLYSSMKKINLAIWDMMDSLRNKNISQDSYLRICKECIEYNDIRFRVKNKINYISKSYLKEQKGYKINKISISINNNIDSSNTILLDIIKYLSFIYDEIYINSLFNIEYLKTNLNYDITIYFLNEFNSNVDYVIECLDSRTLYKLFNIDKAELNKLL